MVVRPETGNIGEDMQFAMLLGYHIDNPCVDPKSGETIREFYLKIAQEQLPTISNEFAREYLIRKIAEYK